jgi:hypothetical protein
MAEFLNTNIIDLNHLNPVVSWKGKTFTQITSVIRKNNTNTIGGVAQKPMYRKGIYTGTISVYPSIFLPNPLKIYRREIANTTSGSNCYQRTSLKIDEFDRPNGSIINTSSTNKNGLVNTIDNTIPKNTCEKPGTCLSFLSPSQNAKRRCRSSGIIKQSYNPSKNCANYYTGTRQYLTSRNKTFLQNQYNYIRIGNSSLKPSSGLTVSNIYSPNGLPVCQKYNIPNNTSFSYQWIDSNYYTVNIPAGYYDPSDFNSKLQFAMTQNYHFLVDKTGSYVFLLAIVYNDSKNLIEFQCLCYNNINFPANNYSCDIRASFTWTLKPTGTGIIPPSPGAGTSLVPGFRFVNGTDPYILSALGLVTTGSTINIPSIPISIGNIVGNNGTQPYTVNQVNYSNINPGLKPTYSKIYYKPNNPQFAQQGAVTSSSLITRKKYNTINKAAYNTNGNIFGANATKAYGGNIANALAYGVSENPYTMKDKIGYPLIGYPSFQKISTQQRNCTETSIPGGVKFNT